MLTKCRVQHLRFLSHNPQSSNFVQKDAFAVCYMHQYMCACVLRNKKKCVLQLKIPDIGTFKPTHLTSLSLISSFVSVPTHSRD